MTPFWRSHRPKGAQRTAPPAQGVDQPKRAQTTREPPGSTDNKKGRTKKTRKRKPMLDPRPIVFLIRMTVKLNNFALGMLNAVSKFLTQHLAPLINILVAIGLLIELLDKVAWFSERLTTVATSVA